MFVCGYTDTTLGPTSRCLPVSSCTVCALITADNTNNECNEPCADDELNDFYRAQLSRRPSHGTAYGVIADDVGWRDATRMDDNRITIISTHSRADGGELRHVVL